MNEININEIWKTEEGKYFTEIEEYLGRKRGYPIILSVKEWYIAKCWFEEGIPISVIKEAIDVMFQKKDMENERLSLAYCNNIVLKIWKDYKKIFTNRIIKEKDSEENKEKIYLDENFIFSHLEGLINNLEYIINNLDEKEEKLRIVFKKTLNKLISLKEKNIDKEMNANLVEKLEQSLIKLEKGMIKKVIDNLPAEILDLLMEEAKGVMMKYEKVLNDIAYRRALETFMKKRLFEQFQIKRFSIYERVINENKTEGEKN